MLDGTSLTIEEMVRVARANDIMPVLITAPSGHRRGQTPESLVGRFVAEEEDLVSLHESYVEVVREVARSNDVPLCDLAADRDGLTSDRWRATYFYSDGVHLTEAGDARVAELLLATLQEHGLLDTLFE